MSYKITFSGNNGKSTERFSTTLTSSTQSGSTWTPFYGDKSDSYAHACGLIIEATGTAQYAGSYTGIRLGNRTIERTGGGGGASPTLGTVKLGSVVPKTYYFCASDGTIVDYINYSEGQLDLTTKLYKPRFVGKNGNSGYIHNNTSGSTGIAYILYVDPKEYIYIDNQSGTFSTIEYPLYKDSDGIYHENPGTSLSNVTLLSPISRHFREENLDVFKSYGMRSVDNIYVLNETDKKLRRYNRISGYKGTYTDEDESTPQSHNFSIQGPGEYMTRTASSKHYYYNNTREDFGILDHVPSQANPLVLGVFNGSFEPSSEFCGVDETIFYASGSYYGIPKTFKVRALQRTGGQLEIDPEESALPTLYFNNPEIGYDRPDRMIKYNAKKDANNRGISQLFGTRYTANDASDPYHFYFSTTSNLNYKDVSRNNTLSTSTIISPSDAVNHGFSARQNFTVAQDVKFGLGIVNESGYRGERTSVSNNDFTTGSYIPIRFTIDVDVYPFRNETLSSTPITLVNGSDGGDSDYVKGDYDHNAWLIQKPTLGNEGLILDTGSSLANKKNFQFGIADNIALFIIAQKIYLNDYGIIKSGYHYAALDTDDSYGPPYGERERPDGYSGLPEAYGIRKVVGQGAQQEQAAGGIDIRVQVTSTSDYNNKTGLVVYKE